MILKLYLIQIQKFVSRLLVKYMTSYFCIILLEANLKISLQEKSEGKNLTWRGCLVLASMSIATDEKRTDVETDEKNAEMATTR